MVFKPGSNIQLPKWKNVQELQEKILNYLEDCKKDNRPLTVTGLANALDTSREVIVSYENRNDEWSDTIKKVKRAIHQYTEERLVSGHNVVGVIFSLKNNWGWKDRTEQDVTVSGTFSLSDLGQKAEDENQNQEK